MKNLNDDSFYERITIIFAKCIKFYGSLCEFIINYLQEKNFKEQIVKLQIEKEQLLRLKNTELQQKLKNQHKTFEKQKKIYAENLVLNALHKQRIDLENKFLKTLHELSIKEPVPDKIPDKIPENQSELYKVSGISLKDKARVFTGSDQIACCSATACSICLTNKVCVLYEPCLHVATCIDCVPRYIILSNKKSCQICNRKITDFRQIFL